MKRTTLQVISVPAPRLAVRSDLHVARKVWHATMGLVIVGIYSSGIHRWPGVVILASVLGFTCLLEAARLKNPTLNAQVMRVWGPVMRSSEAHRVSGVPYYVASSMLAIAIFPKSIAILSILYLAFGDPIASVVGIVWGANGIRLGNGKSLIGTSAGVLTCALVTLIYFSSSRDLTPGQLWATTLLGGLSGGAAELMPFEVDDNFSIPIVAGFVLWFAFILLNFQLFQ